MHSSVNGRLGRLHILLLWMMLQWAWNHVSARHWLPFLCRYISASLYFLMQSVYGLASFLKNDNLVWSDDIQISPSLQFSSVTQSCLILCDLMNSSMPGLPVHHQLPELTQTHVHRVGDTIQPSHPLSSPSSSCPQSLPASGFFSSESTLRMRWWILK